MEKLFQDSRVQVWLRIHDPSKAGFRLQDGWLVATDVPGLGYNVELS